MAQNSLLKYKDRSGGQSLLTNRIIITWLEIVNLFQTFDLKAGMEIEEEVRALLAEEDEEELQWVERDCYN